MLQAAVDEASILRGKAMALSLELEELRQKQSALSLELESRPSVAAFRQVHDRVKELEKALNVRVPVSSSIDQA